MNGGATREKNEPRPSGKANDMEIAGCLAGVLYPIRRSERPGCDIEKFILDFHEYLYVLRTLKFSNGGPSINGCFCFKLKI